MEGILHELALRLVVKLFGSGGTGFVPMFAAKTRRNRVRRMLSYSNWQWHLDEIFVNNGETHYLWRAVDHEGEVLKATWPSDGIAKRR